MISKNKIKYITSLQKKKVRDEERLFVIEGDKIVTEFIDAEIPIKTVLAKPEYLSNILPEKLRCVEEIEEVSADELKQMSSLKTPHNTIAIVPMFERTIIPSDVLSQLCVALDCIQDPGNLGTIIRAAAWFGIRNIVCSVDTVDVYNPKVIQASMGAILHVNVWYYDLKNFVKQANETGTPVFGTSLDGKPVYDHKLDTKGIILLGNESKGISMDLVPFVTEKIKIPGANHALPGIDSLNVSMAASIVFSEFHRRSGIMHE